MRKVTIDYPVVGWGSTEIEVPDDMNDSEIYQAILDDEIEVPYSDANVMSMGPVIDLREWVRNGGDGECVLEMEISE